MGRLPGLCLLLAAAFCGCVGVLAAESPIQAWELPTLDDLLLSPDGAMLVLTGKDRSHKYLILKGSELTETQGAAAIGLPHPMMGPGQAAPLAGGGQYELTIESAGARCGHSVGTHLDVTTSSGETEQLYLIRRHTPPIETHYCGVSQSQEFDAGLVTPIGQPDGRIMLVSFEDPKLAVVVPGNLSSVIALGNYGYLVPGKLLKFNLDAAKGNEKARYKALLSVIKTSAAAGRVDAIPIE